MNTLFGIDEWRWIPRSQRPDDSRGAGSVGRHVSAEGLHDERRRILRVIWQAWTFRGGVALIGFGLAFALIPKTSSVEVINVVLGILLLLTCVFDFAFQVVVGTKRLYFRMKR